MTFHTLKYQSRPDDNFKLNFGHYFLFIVFLIKISKTDSVTRIPSF